MFPWHSLKKQSFQRHILRAHGMSWKCLNWCPTKSTLSWQQFHERDWCVLASIEPIMMCWMRDMAELKILPNDKSLNPHKLNTEYRLSHPFCWSTMSFKVINWNLQSIKRTVSKNHLSCINPPLKKTVKASFSCGIFTHWLQVSRFWLTHWRSEKHHKKNKIYATYLVYSFFKNSRTLYIDPSFAWETTKQ